MKRDDDDGGRTRESQLRLTGRNHPRIMVVMRARPVHLLQLDTGVGYVGVVRDSVCVGLFGGEEVAMCRTMSELRKENGQGKQAAQEESGPTSSTVLMHRL